jgi:hypothetical protein
MALVLRLLSLKFNNETKTGPQSKVNLVEMKVEMKSAAHSSIFKHEIN